MVLVIRYFFILYFIFSGSFSEYIQMLTDSYFAVSKFRDQISMSMYTKHFDDLIESEKIEEIRKIIPVRILEINEK